MNKKYIVSLIIVCVIGFAAFFFLTKRPAAPMSGKLQVTTSFYPLYFFTQTIAGDLADVSNITPAGAEPHDYEPTAQDVAHIEDSQLLILNGGGLEAWGDNIIKNINAQHTHVVIAGSGLTTGQVEEDGKSITDPHIWLSPPLAKLMVEKIVQGFIQIDPSHAAQYQMNADALKVKLDQLDTDYKIGLQQCVKKDIVTSHAAFGYLAAAYGLRQVFITGISPDAEPSSQELTKIVALVKHDMIKYIFFESLVSPKLAETIAQESGAQTLVLDPIEGIAAEDINQGKDYFTLMKDNLKNLQIALQCQP